MVERQPSKLRVAGSNPVSRSIAGPARIRTVGSAGPQFSGRGRPLASGSPGARVASSGRLCAWERPFDPPELAENGKFGRTRATYALARNLECTPIPAPRSCPNSKNRVDIPDSATVDCRARSFPRRVFEREHVLGDCVFSTLETSTQVGISSEAARIFAPVVTALSSHRTSRPSQAHVAQSVEHLHGKEKVIGSIPIVGSTR